MKAKDEEKKIISRVAAEAFLVKDESLLDTDAPFFDWLLDMALKKVGTKDIGMDVTGCLSTLRTNCMRAVCPE